MEERGISSIVGDLCRFDKLPFDFAQGLSLSNGKALIPPKSTKPKDPVSLQKDIRTRPDTVQAFRGIQRLRDACHLRPSGITSPQNDREFDAIALGNPARSPS